jgi:hypothetical protein
MIGCEVDSSVSGQGLVVGSHECSNEPSGTNIFSEFLD